jgi:hypothetical protein
LHEPISERIWDRRAEKGENAATPGSYRNIVVGIDGYYYHRFA